MSDSRPPVPPPDDLDDDVVGHRFLTPDQAQQRAERARAERDQASSGDPDGPTA